jgi:protein MpaA
MSEALINQLTTLPLQVLGASTQGRPLHARRFGVAGGPALLIVGGVHGNEESSVAATIELCRTLEGAPPSQPVWVLPALNPDGIVAGAKDSATGVDLNRNFPASNFTTSHRPGYHPGPHPLSEPETRVLAALCEAESVWGVVAVHAPFACVNYDGPAQAWAERVAEACGWPARADIGYPTPGSLGSWLGRDRGWPVLTIELPPGAYENFHAPAQNALQTAINTERIR